MSKLSENFGRKFVVTGEIAPPRGPDFTGFHEEIRVFKKLWNKVYGINVVDLPGSLLLASPLPAAIILKQNDLEPVYQMTTRDRNMLALEADLLGAAAFGIENVLALTGDHPKNPRSDHPTSKPVFDLDSASLIKTIKRLNEGVDIMGGKINKPTNFFVGAAVAPGVKPIEPEIYKTQRKLDLGCDFFQTQAVFEVSVFADFLKKAESLIGDIRKKVMMTVVPLNSWGMVKFLRGMPGVVISDETAGRIKNAGDRLEEGVNIAAELVDHAKSLDIAGVHITPAGKIQALEKLIEEI